jgi:hypothetical protein
MRHYHLSLVHFVMATTTNPRVVDARQVVHRAPDSTLVVVARIVLDISRPTQLLPPLRTQPRRLRYWVSQVDVSRHCPRPYSPRPLECLDTAHTSPPRPLRLVRRLNGCVWTAFVTACRVPGSLNDGIARFFITGSGWSRDALQARFERDGWSVHCGCAMRLGRMGDGEEHALRAQFEHDRDRDGGCARCTFVMHGC